MRITPIKPEDSAAEVEDARFRVLLWNSPEEQGGSWTLDEWDAVDAHDVIEVLEWAKAQDSDAFEVAVAWPSYAQDRDGHWVTKTQYTRVAGRPGEEPAPHRTEVFTPIR